MARISRLFLGLATALSATATGACVDNQEALIVRHAVAWPSSEENGVVVGSCTIDPNSDTTLGGGLLDVKYGTDYLAPLVIENNLAPRSAEDSPNGIDDSELRILEAEVELTTPQVPDIAGSLDSSLTSFVVPLQSYSLTGGQQAGVGVTAIPAATTMAMADAVKAALATPGTSVQALATITIRGERAVKGGKYNEIQAREFVFPIDLCYGCLPSCAACDTAGLECPSFDATALEGGVCGNAQDFELSPSVCLNG